MRQPGQIFIYSDAELSLIKTVFAENEELIYAIRKVLLQFPMTKKEKEIIKTSMTPEVYAVIKKRVFPELDPESPLSQLARLSTTLTDSLKTKSVEEMEPLFSAKALENDYLTQQFEILKNIDTIDNSPIKLADMEVTKGKSAYDAYVGMTAYLFLLGYIDPMLALIRSIAGQKEESAEQQKERMTRNSTK